MLKRDGVLEEDIPIYPTKKRLQEEKLGGLLDKYNGSPIEIVQALYPDRFYIADFQRVPNRYWYNKENRSQSMRDNCRKHKIPREELSLLN